MTNRVARQHLPLAITCAVEAARLEQAEAVFRDVGAGTQLLIRRGTHSLTIPLGRRAMYPGTAANAARICRDKWTTQALLARHGIPVIRGSMKLTRAQCAALDEDTAQPCFVKPLDGCCGSHTMAVLGRQDLAHYLARTPRTLNRFLLQPYIDAPELRLIVFEGRAYAGYRRVGRLIHGDGKTSYRMLAARATADSIGHRFLIEWFRRRGLDMDAAPAVGHTLEMPGSRNFAQGGAALAPLDEAWLKCLAPLGSAIHRQIGVPVMGIDLFISPESGQAVVIEVNASPDMAGLVRTGQRQCGVDLWRRLIRRGLGAGATVPAWAPIVAAATAS